MRTAYHNLYWDLNKSLIKKEKAKKPIKSIRRYIYIFFRNSTHICCVLIVFESSSLIFLL